MRNVRLMVLVIFLSLVVLFNVFLNSPLARYQRFRCHYGLLSMDPQKVGLLALSNSRGLVAFDSDHFSSEWQRLTGEDIIAWDFGRSWRGPEHHFAMLKDFYEKGHRAERVLLEFNVAKSKKRFHEYTFLTSRFSDLFSMNVFDFKYKMILYRLSSLLKMNLERNVWHLEKLISGKWKFKTPQKRLDLNGDCSSIPELVQPRLLLVKANQKKEKWIHSDFKRNLQSVHEQHNVRYVKKIIQLAKKNGSKVILQYVPEFFGPMMSESEVARVANYFGVHFLQVDREIQVKLFNRGFADWTHVTVDGEYQLSSWLASEVSQL